MSIHNRFALAFTINQIPIFFLLHLFFFWQLTVFNFEDGFFPSIKADDENNFFSLSQFNLRWNFESFFSYKHDQRKKILNCNQQMIKSPRIIFFPNAIKNRFPAGEIKELIQKRNHSQHSFPHIALMWIICFQNISLIKCFNSVSSLC